MNASQRLALTASLFAMVGPEPWFARELPPLPPEPTPHPYTGPRVAHVETKGRSKGTRRERKEARRK